MPSDSTWHLYLVSPICCNCLADDIPTYFFSSNVLTCEPLCSVTLKVSWNCCPGAKWNLGWPNPVSLDHLSIIFSPRISHFFLPFEGKLGSPGGHPFCCVLEIQLSGCECFNAEACLVGSEVSLHSSAATEPLRPGTPKDWALPTTWPWELVWSLNPCTPSQTLLEHLAEWDTQNDKYEPLWERKL